MPNFTYVHNLCGLYLVFFIIFKLLNRDKSINSIPVVFDLFDKFNTFRLSFLGFKFIIFIFVFIHTFVWFYFQILRFLRWLWNTTILDNYINISLRGMNLEICTMRYFHNLLDLAYGNYKVWYLQGEAKFFIFRVKSLNAIIMQEILSVDL